MGRRVFLHMADDKACTFYRNELPCLHCYHELSSNGIEIVAADQPLKHEDFDIFIFNRIIRPDFYENTVGPLLKMGKKFIWQGDDNIWRIPEWNPVHKLVKDDFLASTNYYIQTATKVWTSTEPLNEFIGYPEKTKVLPNLVDPAKFDSEIVRKSSTVKIVWGGSASHEHDLDDVIEPLIHVLEKYGDKIAVIFWGYIPTALVNFIRHPGQPFASLAPKYDNLFIGEWFGLREYFPKLRELKPDIAIMPLNDCEFNRSKSGLKYLEMSMAGAACIATDSKPYEIINHGETGFKLPPNDQAAWKEMLIELIENKDHRIKINNAAREHVRDEHSWHCSAKQIWLDAFLDLF
jgi:glycosyltransferase involved in cell wall biosynthesis